MCALLMAMPGEAKASSFVGTIRALECSGPRNGLLVDDNECPTSGTYVPIQAGQNLYIEIQSPPAGLSIREVYLSNATDQNISLVFGALRNPDDSSVDNADSRLWLPVGISDSASGPYQLVIQAESLTGALQYVAYVDVNEGVHIGNGIQNPSTTLEGENFDSLGNSIYSSDVLTHAASAPTTGGCSLSNPAQQTYSSLWALVLGTLTLLAFRHRRIKILA